MDTRMVKLVNNYFFFSCSCKNVTGDPIKQLIQVLAQSEGGGKWSKNKNNLLDELLTLKRFN